MDREQFLQTVNALRKEGRTIRAIAAELGVHRSRVERALKTPVTGTPDQSPRVEHAAGNIVVGRQQEMRELVASLDDSLRGQGRLVMLVGPPGIGKTRIAQELAAIAEQSGTQVLWGHCHEQQGAPPYWPWIQMIRAHIQRIDADTLVAQMGGGAVEIAEIAPEVRDILPDLEPPPTLEPQQARFRLFDSITSFLKKVSQSQPLVLILEDLHWADRSSLMLLEFLVHDLAESHLLVVGTYRDVELSSQHPLTHTIGEMVRNPHFQLVRLAGLTPDDVGQYIGQILGNTPSQNLVEAIYKRTEGNPFFVTEVVRLWQHISTDPEQAEGEDEWTSAIPDKVSAAIVRRLSHLPESCNRVLTIASVIGSEFGLDQLERVIGGLSAEHLVGVLEEPLATRIIEEVPMGRYRFTHVLIHETLSQALSAAARARLHGEIGEALEGLYVNNLEAHAEELAYHFGEAQMALGSKRLVEYSKMAGERALAAFAYEDALEHFERAMTAKKDQGVDAEAAAILFSIGRAQTATFARAQGQEAIDTLRRAFDAFVDLGDTENAVAVATHPHGFLRFSSGIADMMSRALGLVPPDSLEAGHLLSRHGQALFAENKDHEGAQENLDRAVEIARREGDRALELHALADIAQVHWLQGHYRVAVEQSLPVIESAESLDELHTLVHARIMCASALLNMGDGDEAQKHATAGLEVAERLHNSYWLVLILINNAELAILRGEWKIAQEFNARALAESPRDAIHLVDAALLNLQVGNHEKSSEYIKQVLELVPDVLVGAGIEHASAAVALSLFARVTGTTELSDAAESAAREILSSPSSLSLIRQARVGLALIAIQRSDAESAKEQYSFLKSHRGTQQWVFICCDRLLGLLAQTMGNLAAAQSHFEDALAFCRKAGYRTELAWSLCDYANLQYEQDERHKASILLSEALSISTELGMRTLKERVVALKEQAESQPANAPAYPSGLTEREVEVLRLVATGKTNRDIASELVLSVRTVERHISNIYGKTGARSKAEATAFAFTQGLMPSDFSI